jgi:hypothetical protein
MCSGEQAREAYLSNQLYIEGPIASLNTIGGALADVVRNADVEAPILGDGTAADKDEGGYGENPSGRRLARLYDLNFLRYYGKVQWWDSGTRKDYAGAEQNVTFNQGRASTLLQVLEPGNTDAVYIKYDPPSATLPGFTNPGQGLNLKQRVQ